MVALTRPKDWNRQRKTNEIKVITTMRNIIVIPYTLREDDESSLYTGKRPSTSFHSDTDNDHK